MIYRETVEDDTFAVALAGRSGLNGCSGQDGDCIYIPEYAVRLGYCNDCEDTERSCRFFRHSVDITIVRLCRDCGAKVRDWDVLISVEGLRFDPI